MSDKHDVQMAIVIGFCIIAVLLGIIGGVTLNAHEDNIKSRQVAVECVKHGGNFHQGTNGEMACDQ